MEWEGRGGESRGDGGGDGRGEEGRGGDRKGGIRRHQKALEGTRRELWLISLSVAFHRNTSAALHGAYPDFPFVRYEHGRVLSHGSHFVFPVLDR